MTATRDARAGILAHIARSPGCHLRELERTLRMPLGTLRYHLERLENEGRVRVEYDQRFKRFYEREIEDALARTLSAIRPQRSRLVVLSLLARPGLRHAELARELAIPASSLSSYLDRLMRANVVEATDGRFRVSPTAPVADAIARLEQGIFHKLVDGAIDVFDATERS